MRILEFVFMVFAALITLIGLVFHYTNMPLYELYVKEDHFLEWLQFLFLFATSLTCFYKSYSLFLNSINKLSVLIFLFAGLLFLFGAGEEISWGQRILNLETPKYFEEHNLQEEMNFHNLTVMGVKINKLVFGKILAVVILSYLILLPILVTKIDWIRNFFLYYQIPVPKTQHSVLFVVLVGSLYILDPQRKGELVEFVGISVFFLIFLFPKYNQKVQREESVFDSESNQASVK